MNLGRKLDVLSRAAQWSLVTNTCRRSLQISAADVSQKHRSQGISERINVVRERRLKAGKMTAGVAAYSDSEMFQDLTTKKPKAKRWDGHFSKECQARQPCILKQAAKHMKKPGLISLGGGLPSPTYFPISKLSYQLSRPPSFSDNEAESETVSVGKFEPGSEYDLSVALNYGQAQGSAQILRWITEHAEVVNNPPYADWGCAATSGSTGALEIAVRMFCNGGLVHGNWDGRWDGVAESNRDKVLVEEYSFSTAVETMEALGVTPVSVKMDAEGIVAEELDRIMMDWDRKRGRKPHLLYTVPTGQNPTGATQGAERRKRVYEVCEKHNLFIIEDDPYYFIHMPKYSPKSTVGTSNPMSEEAYMSELPPTYLSMDTSGRVLRFDSFSKVLVPGARMGFVTGPVQVVERFIRYMESAQGPSGFSQAALHTILDRTWGHEGYLEWLSRLSSEYTRRRNTLVRACEEELPDVVSLIPPRAGIFMWLKVDYTRHPHKSEKTILEIEEEIFNSCIDNGVLVARGSWFRADKTVEPSELFFRATYAMAGEDTMREAVMRLGTAIRDSFKI